jgi:hypothetical protein
MFFGSVDHGNSLVPLVERGRQLVCHDGSGGPAADNEHFPHVGASFAVFSI